MLKISLENRWERFEENPVWSLLVQSKMAAINSDEMAFLC